MLEKFLRCFKFAPTYAELEEQLLAEREYNDILTVEYAMTAYELTKSNEEVVELLEYLDEAESALDDIKEMLVRYYE